jgi:hypothetical protein
MQALKAVIGGPFAGLPDWLAAYRSSNSEPPLFSEAEAEAVAVSSQRLD